MPAELIAALKSAYAKGKGKGKLKGVEEGAYVYGSKAMKNWRKKHPGE